MNKQAMNYFEKEDIIHIALAGGPEVSSVEISPNITVELNGQGELVGIEIINASNYLRDTILRPCRQGCFISLPVPIKFIARNGVEMLEWQESGLVLAQFR